MTKFHKNKQQGKVPKKVKKYVQHAIDANVETKNLSVNSATGFGQAALSYGGSFFNMAAITQGIGVNERIGNVIEPVRMKLRGHVTMITAGPSTTTFRYVLLRLRQQPTISLPAIADILIGTGASTAVVNMYNTANTSNAEFQVLLDRTLSMDIGQGLNHTFNINLSKKKLDRLIHYNGAGSNDLGKGSIVLLLISDQPTVSAPSLDIGHQVWYKDA